jgi:anti-sigma regulatory factor (Ser/Thr protein kinase)
MVELRRHFPGNPSQITEMRDFVRTGCRRIWNKASDIQTISQLELAVSEAASNIILHGLQRPPCELIGLVLNIEEQQACITFLYPGCTFIPQAVPKPDFTGRSESGYGLYLIQQSVDEVHYSRNDAGLCTIRFIKNRR